MASMQGPYDHFFNPNPIGFPKDVNIQNQSCNFAPNPSNPYQTSSALQLLPPANTAMGVGHSPWNAYEPALALGYKSQDPTYIETQALDLEKNMPSGRIPGMGPQGTWENGVGMPSTNGIQKGRRKTQSSDLLALENGQDLTGGGDTGNNSHLQLSSHLANPIPSVEEQGEEIKKYQKQLSMAYRDFELVLLAQECERMERYGQLNNKNHVPFARFKDRYKLSEFFKGNTNGFKVNDGTTVREPDQMRPKVELFKDGESDLSMFKVSALEFFLQYHSQPKFDAHLAGIFKFKSLGLEEDEFLEREGQVEHSEETGGVPLFYNPDSDTPHALWGAPPAPLPPHGNNLEQKRFFKFIWMMVNPPKNWTPQLPQGRPKFKAELAKLMSNENKKEPAAAAASWVKAEVWSNGNSDWI